MPGIDPVVVDYTEGALARYADALDHVRLISDRRERLLDDQVDTENQFLRHLAADYELKVIGVKDLEDAYFAYRSVAAPKFSLRWDAIVPVTSSTIQIRTRHGAGRPNGPNGTWRGECPLDPWAPAPIAGVSVVYILFDLKNVPCYVGSSKNLRSRLKRHARDKEFGTRQAFACKDREAAYELEVRLLGERKPYLNKKVGR
jgi:GIY-YIG catalytic domain